MEDNQKTCFSCQHSRYWSEYGYHYGDCMWDAYDKTRKHTPEIQALLESDSGCFYEHGEIATICPNFIEREE